VELTLLPDRGSEQAPHQFFGKSYIVGAVRGFVSYDLGKILVLHARLLGSQARRADVSAAIRLTLLRRRRLDSLRDFRETQSSRAIVAKSNKYRCAVRINVTCRLQCVNNRRGTFSFICPKRCLFKLESYSFDLVSVWNAMRV